MLGHVTVTRATPEVWVAVPGFSRYTASDQGRICNVVTGRILTPTRGDRGYWRISNLRGDDGRVVTRHVHTLVMLAHRGERPDGPDGKPLEICHGNGKPVCRCHGRPVKDCNWLVNLRYDTAAANRWDRFGKPRSRWSRAWRAWWEAWKSDGK
jgi:NUMOD4 motif-containing protein